MRMRSLFKVAFQSILRHRMRSVLTMLGIIIGVGAVIMMVSIGQGVQKTINDQIAGLGANVLMVFPQASTSGGVSMGAGTQEALTLADVDRLRTEGSAIKYVSPIVRSNVQVIGGIGNWSTSVQGVYPSFLDIRQWNLSTGEFFTERDINSRGKVAVVGKTIVDNLFPGSDPIGQHIRLGNVPFEIVGVLESKGQGSGGQDQDDIILAPATTVLDRLSGRRFIQQILVSAASEQQMDAAKEEITALLRETHEIRDGEEIDFSIRSQTEIAETAQATTQVLTMFLASIAGVSLVVGGIGIMNIMLVSVTERTREIGIRMAIGARGSDVLMQFLIESVVLSVLGGIIGILFGVGGAKLLSVLASLTTVVSPMVIAISFLFSAVIGVTFGFYPARKAAALNPIEALRYE